MDAHVTKPIDVADLFEVIDSLTTRNPGVQASSEAA
jgi:hypothetical protein